MEAGSRGVCVCVCGGSCLEGDPSRRRSGVDLEKVEVIVELLQREGNHSDMSVHIGGEIKYNNSANLNYTHENPLLHILVFFFYTSIKSTIISFLFLFTIFTPKTSGKNTKT